MAPRTLLRLAEWAILLALLVVLLGGWTRLNDAGLSCPDWPGCYGELVIPGSAEAQAVAQSRYPGTPLDVGRGWIEMSHRYVAASLGVLIAALAFGGWRYRRQGSPWRLGLGLLGLVVLQALFGMWTVTLKLLPQVVTLHLLGGLLTLFLLVRLRQRLGAWVAGMAVRPLPLRPALGVAVLLLFVQIALGGWTSANYAGWSCSHWWSCEREQAVSLDFAQAFSLPAGGENYLGGHLAREARAAIQMSHRGTGLLLGGYLLGLALVLLRRDRTRAAAVVLVAVLGLQLSLGALSVIHGLPLALAMAHHAGAVGLVLTLVWLYGRAGFQQEESHG